MSKPIEEVVKTITILAMKAGSQGRTYNEFKKMIANIITQERQQCEDAVREERERWIKSVGEKIDLPTSVLIKNAFQEGVDSTKEAYENALSKFATTNTPDNIKE